MVWLEAPGGLLHAIDTDADFSDCLPTNLFGKNGLVVLHRHSQLRFYEIPAASGRIAKSTRFIRPRRRAA